MVTKKKLSMAIAGAVISALCLNVKYALADENPLLLPNGVFLSTSTEPTNVGDSVFIGGEYTSGQYAVVDGFAPPLEGPTPHKHFLDGEGFYVLEGKTAFHLGNQTFVGEAGDFVYIPQGETHSWINVQTEPSRSLVILNPPEVLKYLEQVRAGLLSGGEQGYLEAVVNSAPDYATEVSDSLLFDDFEYKINRDGSSTATISVRRLGPSKEPASATIVLSDGTATLGEDYSSTEIPIYFAGGNVSEVVNVPIPLIKDSLSEGNKTIQLTLTNPSGNTIIAPLQSKAILSIVDDNPLPGSNDSHTPLTVEEIQELYGWQTLQTASSQIQSFWLGGGTADVIATASDTDENYSLFNVSLPAETGLKPYINSQEDNGFYLLDGKARFKFDDQLITLNPGNFLFIPKNTPYEFGNLETTSARLALISTIPTSVPESTSSWSILAFAAFSASLLLRREHQNKRIA